MGIKKLQKTALERAIVEAGVYGCTVRTDGVDGKNHLRLIIYNPRTDCHMVHTVGGSPRNDAAMVNGVGNAVRRKARALVGLGPTG